MRSALQQNSHPAEFIVLGGDEQRMALDGSFYTASEFCHFYRDVYLVDALWFWENGNGIENDYMLDNQGGPARLIPSPAKILRAV